MTSGNTRTAVIAEATTIALVGTVFGVPLGVVVGRLSWKVISDRIPLEFVSPLALGALALVVALAFVLAERARGPARATRCPSAAGRRAEGGVDVGTGWFALVARRTLRRRFGAHALVAVVVALGFGVAIGAVDRGRRDRPGVPRLRPRCTRQPTRGQPVGRHARGRRRDQWVRRCVGGAHRRHVLRELRSCRARHPARVARQPARRGRALDAGARLGRRALRRHRSPCRHPRPAADRLARGVRQRRVPPAARADRRASRRTR